MPARIETPSTSLDGKHRVVCDDAGCPRPLDWTVHTRDHAVNLRLKHDRENHPTARLAEEPVEDTVPEESYDVTAAARVFLASHDGGAAAVWHALTGLRGQAAEEAAELAADRQTTAYLPPI